jgi:UrcA family protein
MRTLISAVGLSVLALAPMAQAGEQEVRIPVAEADVASPAALAALYERIEKASKQVCAEALSGSILEIYGRQECRAQVADQAIRNSHLPALIGYHEAQLSAPSAEQATLASR